MNRDEEYTPSGFNRHDYHDLVAFNYDRGVDYFSSMIRRARYRDKRVQRNLKQSYPQARRILRMPLEEVALHISHKSPAAAVVAQWRMKLGR